MLNKRIDLGSIPVGLYAAGEDITKGSAVVLKNGKIYLPATADEANAVLGFATLVIDCEEGSDVSHDVIPAGRKVVVYTLVQNNRWGTSQFDTAVAPGDAIGVGFSGANKGKLIKAADTGLFRAVEKYNLGSTPMIDVDVI